MCRAGRESGGLPGGCTHWPGVACVQYGGVEALTEGVMDRQPERKSRK